MRPHRWLPPAPSGVSARRLYKGAQRDALSKKGCAHVGNRCATPRLSGHDMRTGDLRRLGPMTARATYKKSEVSRRSVVEAAVRALAEQGFAKTSVSDIAHSAGMSKGVVHYHFANKDDLIARVLEHCSSVVRERARVAWDLGGTPTERIRRLLREAWAIRREGIPEIRVIMDLMAQAVHEPHLRGAVRAMMEATRAQIIADLICSLE